MENQFAGDLQCVLAKPGEASHGAIAALQSASLVNCSLHRSSSGGAFIASLQGKIREEAHSIYALLPTELKSCWRRRARQSHGGALPAGSNRTAGNSSTHLRCPRPQTGQIVGSRPVSRINRARQFSCEEVSTSATG